MSTVDQILDAAERIFAAEGYGGASMREIASCAGVSQALLHYHFKNKELLYRRIFERRADRINDVRVSRLEAIFDGSGGASLEEVLEVLFYPHDDEDMGYFTSAYRQLVTMLSVAEDARSTEIMIKHYDPIAEVFIEAICRAVPGLARERAVWAYLFALGARQQATARNSRATRLSGGSNFVPYYPLILKFVAAGIRDLAAPGSP